MEAIKDKSAQSQTAAVYFYCQDEDRNMLRGVDLLASFTKQLLVFLETLREPWPREVRMGIVKFFGKKRSEPDFDDLFDNFSTLFTYMDNTTYIIDGLDQFEEGEIEMVLKMARRLFGNKIENHGSRILIFSRDPIAAKLDMSRSIPDTVHISIPPSLAGRDIQLYIETMFEEKTAYTRELTQDPNLLKETKKTLLEKASGMWV